MDKASEYESSDAWVKFWQNRKRHCFLTRTLYVDGNFNHLSITFSIGPVALWIRRLTSKQKIIGSRPSRIVVFGILT